MKKSLVLAILFVVNLFIQFVIAQDNGYNTRPFQVTLITPIGTNGIMCGKYTNELSLNIIAGYNGGLDGFEAGGFANILKANGDGFQVAGFGNIVGENFSGLQGSGFMNMVYKDFEGIQLSGFANINGRMFDGFQGTGFANIAGNGSEIFQLSGFGNVLNGNTSGLQTTGFMNVADNLKGVQLSGFMNLAEEIKGAQISGFINISHKVEGLQLSFINLCDSIDGIPIGFLSLAKNGIHTFEFWGSDALHMNLAYKSGVKRFYNIFAAGVHFTGGFTWALGYGFGTQFNFSEETIFNLEAVSYDIINNFRGYNSLNQLKFNYGMEYDNNKSFFVGPTFNVLITDNSLEHELAPYIFYSRSSFKSRNTVKMWIGINAGLRF